MKSTEHRRTRHFNIMLVILAATGLVTAFIAVDPAARAFRETQHGRMDQQEGEYAAMAFCSGMQDERVGQIGPYLNSRLKLNPAQKTSWARVEQELKRGLAELRSACGDLAAGVMPATIPERLAVLESAVTAGADALRTVRPAFAEFYGTLDEGQRTRIDELSARHTSGIR